MKEFFRASLLALVVASGSAAYAAEPAGHAFCKEGMGNPEELALRVASALKADPSGKTKIERCLATPQHLLLSFQENDPGAGIISVSELPEYLRALVATSAQEGFHYQSNTLHEKADGALVVAFGAVTRSIRRGERIYRNPNTGKLVLMSSCVNPGVIEVPPIVVRSMRCVTVKFPGRKGAAIRFAFISDKLLPGHCTELSLSGEVEPRFDMPEECADRYTKVIGGRKITVTCKWDEVERAVSQNLRKRSEVQNVSGSFNARGDGANELRLPAEALEGSVAVCFERPDGSTITLGVSRGHYVDGVATIPDALVFGK